MSSGERRHSALNTLLFRIAMMAPQKCLMIVSGVSFAVLLLIFVAVAVHGHGPENDFQDVPQSKLVVFTATWYPDVDQVRFRQAVHTLTALVAHGLSVVVVDGSPDEEVRNLLRATGAVVQKQTSQGKKGAALREAAQLAATQEGVTDSTWLCWQEPEKTDMARHWAPALLAEGSQAHRAEVAVPARNEESFRDTYPIEQFHSETYGNMYLDAVASEALQKAAGSKGGKENVMDVDEQILPPIDWHFGPFAFRAAHLQLWTHFDGEMYDAQVVPIVHAARKGLQVASVPVSFEASLHMKKQEEGNVAFIEKRLWQLNLLDPVVKQAWDDEFYC
eukprot:INCI9737.1.p1 GENE.INCI9737.1~~INCI9737.1.p1  ORF type:complete len:333 (+),score=58.22 INCI9737.1:133-1131(+)